MRALQEFVDAQTAYFVSAAARVQQLQSLVREKVGDLTSSSSFPRRDSKTNNVPVADILKVALKTDAVQSLKKDATKSLKKEAVRSLKKDALRSFKK